ncbi:hypothetical protein F4811DRAFT_566614 [Daldinia bambusicola]|nr:hypothetical protein F4811DRAFT_566614 [Daldinia bambusicola]
MLLSSVESSPASPQSEWDSEFQSILQGSNHTSGGSEIEKDFPPEIYEDRRPVSPITDRWPNHNPWEYYIDRDGNAVPFPPEEPAAPLPVRAPQPPLSLGDLDIIPSMDYQPGQSPRCTFPNFHEQLTIRQRRQLKRLASTLKQPFAIILPTKRNYDNSQLLIHNLDQERVYEDLARHPLAPIAEPDEAHFSHDEGQSAAVSHVESYGESYVEFNEFFEESPEQLYRDSNAQSSGDSDEEYPKTSNKPDTWENQNQDELSNMDKSKSASGNNDQSGIDRYLASISNPIQREKTIRAGMAAMWPSNHEVNNVWRHPYYRGPQEDGDYETWFGNTAREFGWHSEDPYYEPEDDGETWREVAQPQIGDEGIPDQAALDYVLAMRENRERLEAAIRRRRELWEERFGGGDSFAATFGGAYDADNECADSNGKGSRIYGGSDDSSDGDADDEGPASPPSRRVRIKLVNRAKEVVADEAALAARTSHSQTDINPDISSGTLLNSASGPDPLQPSGSPPSSASPPQSNSGRGRGRGRPRGRPRGSGRASARGVGVGVGRGRGRKRKGDPDADFEPESSGPDVQSFRGRKRHRTTRQ